MTEIKWWQNSTVYQVYPRSFQDSNGDGIGDIQGVIQRLDYLQQLGINLIWLCPIYGSPNDDNGYDISDYRGVHPEFGTMEDVTQLIAEAKKRDVRIIMDLVVNHTSDEHMWFQEALKSKDNPYRDYYVWRDPQADGGPPNDLESTFSGSAWQLDEASGQYYLHLFSKKQPDLNWENPKVQQEVWDLMNFWLEKGIAGFRMDVIELIAKDPDKKITANGLKLHPLIQEMTRQTLSNYDVMSVGETWGATPEIAQLFSAPERKELSMVFQFEHVTLDQEPGKSKWDYTTMDPAKLHAVLSKWQTELAGKGWNSLFWNNHDLPRVVSHFGDDSNETNRVLSAKMLAIYLYFMQGTTYLYQGEELGMTNFPVTDINQVDDIESVNYYNQAIEAGLAKETLLDQINKKGRDNARHPMQWDSSDNAGFTTGIPWLPINSNYKTINVEATLNDKDSIFYTYQHLIGLRKKEALITFGDYTVVETNNPLVLAYKRHYEGEEWLVVVNFSKEAQAFELAETSAFREVIIQNTDNTPQNKGELSPFEAFAVKL